MSYGFYTTTDAGLLQIDSEFSNLALIEQGALTQYTFNVWSYPINEDDIYFLRVVQADQYVYSYTGHINGILYLFIGTATDYPANPYGPGLESTIEYLRCKPSRLVLTIPPTSGYGLNVIRPDGNLAYSSQLVCPEIAYVATVDTSALDLFGENKIYYTIGNVPSGKKRYFGCNSFNNIGGLMWRAGFEEPEQFSGCFLSAANSHLPTISVKISRDFTDAFAIFFGGWRIDSNNQLLIVEF